MSMTSGTNGPRAVAVDGATEEYGRRLLTQTSLLLGPDHPDPRDGSPESA